MMVQKKVGSRSIILLSLFLSLTLAVSTAFAAEKILTKREKTQDATVRAYWTSERLQAATEYVNVMPTVAGGPSTESAASVLTNTDEKVVSMDGTSPTLSGVALRSLETTLTGLNSVGVQESDVVPQDFLGVNFPYSSQPLVPRTARTTFPYRAAGRLFFTTPSGNSWCSASVIRHRILVTAGHCVHRGSGGQAGFYTNHLFVPAYDNGVATFGSWTARVLGVSGPWSVSNGSVPNAEDWGMVELNDQVISGVLRRVYNLTGYFGWRTFGLLGNHVHTLGYPQNHDAGNRMRQNTAQVLVARTPNCGELGSNLRGGSSGGPWVQNFASDCAGTNCGANSGKTQVVAVTSYGPVSTAFHYQGASNFNGNFVTLYNIMCGLRTGNCS